MSTPNPQPAKSFNHAISVTPLSSHAYSANLRSEWCIGTVPHGGYVTSVFYNVARRHMLHTHPKMHAGNPTPITMHVTFIRRTNVGTATFRIEDTKLGSRTSTLHITLSQLDGSGKTRDEVSGYVTISNMESEEGPNMRTGYELVPAPAPGSGTGAGAGAVVNLNRLSSRGEDGAWKRFDIRFASMRKASKQMEFYIPTASSRVRKGFVEQWVRFKPYGEVGRWTNEALGFLVDMFPMMLETFDDRPWEGEEQGEGQQGGKKKDQGPGSWYPTVLLNVDFKKMLPVGGVEWLYSRVHTKVLKNGRMDLDVVVMDEGGDVVALSNHVALIVDAARNLSARSNGNGNGTASKI